MSFCASKAADTSASSFLASDRAACSLSEIPAVAEVPAPCTMHHCYVLLDLSMMARQSDSGLPIQARLFLLLLYIMQVSTDIQ